MRDLAGKVVLVTGASSGIGAATAEAFGRAGARVAVHYNRSAAGAAAVADAVRAAGSEAIVLQADVRDTATVERLVADTHARFGALDVVVNNAGDLLGRHDVEDVLDDFVLDVFRVNALSVIAACRAAVPLLRASGGGVIVNLSSVSARTGGSPGTMFYAATKAYVASITRSMAKVYAADGIRINTVAPGVITTPIHDRHTPPEVMATLADAIPMRRLGDASEVAEVILFLASDASSYMTGEVLEVNGGVWMG
ncbi:MAG: SDR family oxidoreductase [Alphaproteobacteria bacterium]|nr:SDR family oxidoreductase [Alphaproteobacteria bacterium]